MCETRLRVRIVPEAKRWKTVHHLYIAKLKKYVSEQEYDRYSTRYMECVRMLNGLERTLEQQLDPSSRRWPTPGESS